MKLPNLAQALALPNGQAAAVATGQLEAELERRRSRLTFPLDVFPEAFKPYITAIVEKMQIDRGFAGLSVLQTTASAIGSGLRVQTGPFKGPVNIWSGVVGLTSSGKSVAQGEFFDPIKQLQARYDREYQYASQEADEEGEKGRPVYRKALVVKDITFESLIRDVFAHNFRGITKYEDELVKLLKDLTRYKSSQSEEPFLVAGWDSKDNFTMQRVGKKMDIIERQHLVINMTGTTQRNLLRYFYEGDRLYSGFAYRFLFVLAETERVTDPSLSDPIPEEFRSAYTRVIERLLRDYDMPYRDSEAREWRIPPSGLRMIETWQSLHSLQINTLSYGMEKEVRAGIFGKVKVYISRFAALLQALHYAAAGRDVDGVTTIETDFVTQAIQLGDYFMQSNWEAFCVARAMQIAPPDVLEFLGALKACHFNQSDLARRLKISKQAVNKKFKDYGRDYPHLFARTF